MHKVVKILLLTLSLLCIGVAAFAASSFTPDSLKALFDAKAVFIMLVWGIIQTRVPKLGVLANNFVGWFNAIGYCLTALLVGPAHAGIDGGAISGGIGAVIAGALGNASIAHILYETLGRSILDRFFAKYDTKHPGGVKAPGA